MEKLGFIYGTTKREFKDMATYNPEDIISHKEIIKVHANADFGGYDKRDIVNLGLLKCACGYYQGSTSKRIIEEHGLVDKDYTLTVKGRKYLWEVFGDGNF